MEVTGEEPEAVRLLAGHERLNLVYEGGALSGLCPSRTEGRFSVAFWEDDLSNCRCLVPSHF